MFREAHFGEAAPHTRRISLHSWSEVWPVSSYDASSNTGSSLHWGMAASHQISLPKGGGAIRGIGEKFAANPVTGTGSLTVPIATSPGRSGFGPQLSLSYDSGAGNGPFGFGWSLSLPAITRRTDKGLPRYRDAMESDSFILSGAEDLVPVLVQDQAGQWNEEVIPPRDGYSIKAYRPRIEGLFARIERWTRQSDGDTHWRDDLEGQYYELLRHNRRKPHRRSGRSDAGLLLADLPEPGRPGQRHRLFLRRRRFRPMSISRRRTSATGRRPSAASPIAIRLASNTAIRPRSWCSRTSSQLSWLFEVAFDYGEGYLQQDPPDSRGPGLRFGEP